MTVFVGPCNDGLPDTHTVGIVGIADDVGAVGGGGKLATPFPTEAPGGTVIIAGGVADGIVGNRFSINCRQQIMQVGWTYL